MTVPAFSPCDRSTWGETLTLDQVAQIFNQKPGGIRQRLKPSCRRVAFSPRPKYSRPLRWLKADVIRALDSRPSLVGLRRSA